MGELTYLLSSYSGSELVMIFVVGLLAVTVILKAASYLWEKVKDYFNIKNKKSQWEEQLSGKIDGIAEDTSILKQEVSEMREAASQRAERLAKVESFTKEDYEREQEILERLDAITGNLNNITNRLQDDARWAFKDAYNYYAVNKGYIDPLSLEALENKYEHYVANKGNSFVSDVMEKLRMLPVRSYEDEKAGESIDK